jgi:ATP-dependent DNA helicase PIF1
MFPFILSWTITIRKTQGVTIEKAVISLSDCFAYNMKNVALSRIKTIKGLAILNLDLKRFDSNKFTRP